MYCVGCGMGGCCGGAPVGCRCAGCVGCALCVQSGSVVGKHCAPSGDLVDLLWWERVREPLPAQASNQPPTRPEGESGTERALQLHSTNYLHTHAFITPQVPLLTKQDHTVTDQNIVHRRSGRQGSASARGVHTYYIRVAYCSLCTTTTPLTRSHRCCVAAAACQCVAASKLGSLAIHTVRSHRPRARPGASAIVRAARAHIS